MSVAVAILCLRLSTMPRLHTTSPLSRSAGEGPGVRAAPSAGEEGGDERSRGNPVPASLNDAASIHHITPLPQRGRGAGGEGRPHLPTSSLPLPHGQRKGEGEWATVMKGILQP